MYKRQKKIINDYASKDYAVIKSADDIKDYKTLKAVAESINEHKDDLGVDGAFATPGLDASPTHTVSPRIWGASRCTTSTRT